MTAQNEATARQVQAARPGASIWLSANAGSGKTRVLTDRVTRLLLDGVSPQNILCLTYTKAAASEMQNRLFKRLGTWAMASDADLQQALANLGLDDIPGTDRLANARTLFARAIETPGGLKIQTIHSFCAALLRRFPLEAGVSPQFVEMDERTSNLLIADVIEEMSDVLAPSIIDGLARHYTGEDFSAITKEVARHRDKFLSRADASAIRSQMGVSQGQDAGTLLASVFLGDEAALLRRVASAMKTGTSTDLRHAETIVSVADMTATMEGLEALESVVLFGPAAKAPFAAKSGGFPTKNTRTKLADDLPALDALMERVETGREMRLALLAVEKTLALHSFAHVFLPLYQNRKLARGWLDFDDLILKARDLMTDPAVANWVLFRLDGRIDHILVDEAQDTSPTQWQVIELLTQEFASGEGPRKPLDRSLFVVGDRKQSIYSFQGADPEAFRLKFEHFKARLSGSAPLLQLELQYSFRSSAAILRAVDATFHGDSDGPLNLGSSHRAFHDTLPGRVDLWPPLEAREIAEETSWEDPVDRLTPAAADIELSRMIAAEIRRMIDAGETVPTQNGPRRPVSEGDFLILVQRRNRLFSEIIRACKKQDLRIAGADRLKLGAELAVRDLRALLAFLATPEDDLSLACALRSPLFGWSEQDLYALAAPRKRDYLWTAFRNSADDRPVTRDMLGDLRNKAEFLRPFDLLERILLHHKGRANLLARLGAEAEDGIDELLNQALAYERLDIPSLTGFLAWLDTDDVEIKRQIDSAGQRIRVMSVHGAKGLEAPIVILPDTLRPPGDIRAEIWPAENGTPLWRMAKDDMPEPLRRSKALLTAAESAERARLLYVAMTRAETWLIVCGAGKQPSPSWYDAVRTGLERLETTAVEFPSGRGMRLSHDSWSAGKLESPADSAQATIGIPNWMAAPAPAFVEDRTQSPSALGGEKVLPGTFNILSEEMAKKRGTALHLLLEHLPQVDVDLWNSVAQSLLGAEAAMDLLPEARSVLTAPNLLHLFQDSALAEVGIAGTLWGDPIVGIIDRLLVTKDEILAVDFKSNQIVPDSPADVPEGLLRQMGAYAHMLAEIYPKVPVKTAILWTHGAVLMPLPDDITASALANAARS